MERVKVCVIGAGTMGSGIAAHMANLGHSVTLLDRTRAEARAAFARAREARPPHFRLEATADLIRLGGADEDLQAVAEADWVCEAVVEKLGVKKAIFALVEPLLKPDAMISTNTSGLQISLLAADRSESFRRRFHGAHFFNPPRYLKLLELIPTEETDPEEAARAVRFLEGSAARRVVVAKDTPGFIANRYGMWCMYWATACAEALGLSIEEADLIAGPFLGRPKTGVFRLNDLVGLDVMQDIASNLIERCPEDPRVARFADAQSVSALIDKGWIGGKAGQGYFRREGRELMALDLRTLAYRQLQTPAFESIDRLARAPLADRLQAALELKDPVGEFVRRFLPPALAYAVELGPQISHSVQDFDRVMRWGFGWEAGPFEQIDGIGAERLGLAEGGWYQGSEMRSFSGAWMPKRIEPEFRALADYPIIEDRGPLRIRDLGEGVHSVSLLTKMGAVSPEAVRALHQILDEKALDRFVLAGEGSAFSVGFDLRFFVQALAEKDDSAIAEAIESLQNACVRLSETRSVAAVHGWCLGGGFELALGCPRIAADAEAKIGLPESRVGLIPGGGGTMRMRMRAGADGQKLAALVAALASGRISENADDAARIGYLGRGDVVVDHPDGLITRAREEALRIEPEARPWSPVSGPLGGMVDAALEKSSAAEPLTGYDRAIAERLKNVMTKAASLEDGLERERTAFFELIHDGQTLARMNHMLETGKPLRN